MAQTLVCLRVHVVEELVTLLNKYQVEYDERYISGSGRVRAVFRGRCPRLLYCAATGQSWRA